ncbi:MAG: DUF5667 domain-containing protein [Candidatus Pacebacteria bacterium]|nr:DUF5667 domain-containing protein [Candidatus Paceibacterota bacterium]
MNKKIIITLALIISFSFTGSFANAGEEANILPNNPLYFFKDLGRQIQDLLTLDSAGKIELRLKIAEEKLAEIEQVAEKNPNNPNYQKYLKNYEQAVGKIQKNIDKLDAGKEEILENIATKIINHEERLEELKNIIRSDKREAVDQIKNNVINNYTETSLKIADEEAFKNKMRERIQNMGEEKAIKTVNRIQNEAPQNLKSILNKIDVVQNIREKGINNSGQELKEIIQSEQLIDKVNKDAQKLGLTPEEILEKVATFSEEDKTKLQQYALEILAGNKSEEDIVKDFNKINLSPDALQKIESLANQNQSSLLNEASKYCINQGNKVLVEKDSNGNEIRFCISKDGKKCNELDFFNKKCSF